MRTRWLIAIAAGLLPLVAGAALQQSTDDARPSVGGPQAKVTNPHGPISIPCQECHTYTSWKPIRSNPEFNHDQTGYPLRGMHAKVPCTKCHVSLVFKNVSTGCADCHADIHRRQFGTNCESCHSVKGWQTSLAQIRDHQNRFPLVGAHAMLQCDDCHKNAAVGPVHRTFDFLLFLPSAGLSDQGSRSRCGGLSDHVRLLPHHGHMVQRQV